MSLGQYVNASKIDLIKGYSHAQIFRFEIQKSVNFGFCKRIFPLIPFEFDFFKSTVNVKIFELISL